MENLMKKKWALYLLLSTSLIFTSCFNSEQKEQISKHTFIEIFRELEYLKASYEMGFITDSIYNLESENIFSKNNLNQEDFQNQIKEYLEDLPEFESILKELQSKLESN
tara:strand:+ start:1791 stop:2117 length:327 start_codon:yes stop_codon:yes gene_type:complete